MIQQRVLLDMTPRQAELALEALGHSLLTRTAGQVEDNSDNQRIRALIATIKDQL
jgi:hypothetical protein